MEEIVRKQILQYISFLLIMMRNNSAEYFATKNSWSFVRLSWKYSPLQTSSYFISNRAGCRHEKEGKSHVLYSCTRQFNALNLLYGSSSVSASSVYSILFSFGILRHLIKKLKLLNLCYSSFWSMLSRLTYRFYNAKSCSHIEIFKKIMGTTMNV